MIQNIAIRVDGGKDIGMGHVIRCLSLATEFRDNKCNVWFLSKMQEGIDRIKEDNFQVIDIKGNIESGTYNSIGLKIEAQRIIDILKVYNIDLLLIDTYNVTQQFFLNLKSNVKILGYIDDLNKFVYPVDILINGSAVAKHMKYEKYSQSELLLLGPKYNLIRKEFSNIHERIVNKKVEAIMVTAGGVDNNNVTCKIINMLLSNKNILQLNINVIVGKHFRGKKNLKKIANINKNIILYENVKYMSEIMLISDIAISAGGSTLYELCACGTPTLAYIIADNQKFVTKKMDELGYIKLLGDFNTINTKYLNETIDMLCKDYKKRMQLSKIMQGIVDGYGATRAVRRILDKI